jgi:hypothetical protein
VVNAITQLGVQADITSIVARNPYEVSSGVHTAFERLELMCQHIDELPRAFAKQVEWGKKLVEWFRAQRRSMG